MHRDPIEYLVDLVHASKLPDETKIEILEFLRQVEPISQWRAKIEFCHVCTRHVSKCSCIPY